MTIPVFAVLLCAADVSRAQEPGAEKTLLEIELLTPPSGGDLLAATRWRQTFEKVGEAVRIRHPIGDDKPDLTESVRGPYRLVKIVGRIDRNGQLVFPGRSFRSSEHQLIREWLDEIKVYGALGSPEGKAMWGLTDAQFQEVFAALSQSVREPVIETSLGEALLRIPLGDPLTIQFHSSVEERRQAIETSRVVDEVQGLTAGTALAFLLSQQKLGFRPLRTPSGRVQLVVQPLTAISDPWPVGWPLDESMTRLQVLPSLFEMVTTGYESARVGDVLNAVEENTRVRILVDLAACEAKGFDFDAARVSFPRKHTAWSLIVRSAAISSRMSVNYLQDEAGTGFLLIAPFIPRPANQPPRRFVAPAPETTAEQPD